MRILIADDDLVSRRILEAKLARWGYEVVSARDGREAWQILESIATPKLAILDWMMPEMDGVEICRRLRDKPREPYIYVILLTTMNREEDLIVGIEAGADDYLTKPFKSNELRVRLHAGCRILDMENELITARQDRDRLIADLQDALARVKTLSGMLPICASCKKIRDDSGYWNQLETYITLHSEAIFSHGYCPDCYKKAYAEVEKLKGGKIDADLK